MKSKTSIKKSLFLLYICAISILISGTPILGSSQTTEPLLGEFAPELVPGSNFTWKVNEWLEMDEWLNPDTTYDPKSGDLWNIEIKKSLPDLLLDGSVTWNISDWSFEFDGSLDVEENFEYNIAGNTFLDTFGIFGDDSHNWKMMCRLFLLPYRVDGQPFADFYESLLINIGADFVVETNGESLSIEGNLTTGEYQEDRFEINASLGLIDSFTYQKKPFGNEIWTSVVNISLVESYIPEPLIGHFAPEILPGSKFKWKVNEWQNNDDLLNPGINYIPQSGDLWSMEVKETLPDIPVPQDADWDILGWHIEDFEFPTFPTKDDSQLLMDIAGHSYYEVFGNESDDGESWKMLLFLFLLPDIVEVDNGEEESFGKFMPATFGGIEINVTVKVGEDEGGLQLEGSINGEYEDSEITLNASLGVVESFTYKRRSPVSQEWSSVLNISLIESYIPDPKPEIPGYSYLIGFSIVFVGIIIIVVSKQIRIMKIK